MSVESCKKKFYFDCDLVCNSCVKAQATATSPDCPFAPILKVLPGASEEQRAIIEAVLAGKYIEDYQERYLCLSIPMEHDPRPTKKPTSCPECEGDKRLCDENNIKNVCWYCGGTGIDTSGEGEHDE